MFPLSLLGQNTSGTEFWFGFMNNFSSPNSLRIYVSSAQTSKVYVNIPLQNFRDSFIVLKDSVVKYEFNISIANPGATYNQSLPKGIQITSQYPVSVSAMNLQTATTDASVVLPLVNVPKKVKYTTIHPSRGSTSIALLVANEDSTKITIKPSVLTLDNKLARVNFNITLNRGETYQLASNNDLSGSEITVTSDHKLMVFSGDKCSNFPSGACDHQYEIVLPEVVLDTAYLAAPQLGFTGGYVLKIIPLDTNTNITINKTRFFPNVSKYNPLVINVSSDSGFYISGNKKFHCAQFLKGPPSNQYITSGYGDPALLELVSAKHMGESSLFSTVNSTNLRDHFVSIVIKTISKDLVYLNNAKIDSSEFRVFPYNKDYSYCNIRLNLGSHTVTCTEGHLAYCYGIGSYESYFYLAGFNLPNFDLVLKDSITEYDCKNKKIKVQFKDRDNKYTNYKWYFSDNTVYTGNPIVKTFNVPSEMSYKLVGTDSKNKKDSLTKNIKVDWPRFKPTYNKLLCGPDSVKYIELNPFFSNFKWQDSSNLNTFSTKNSQNIWVRATDTSGYCVFYDSAKVQRIGSYTKINIDSIQTCFKNNLFILKDSSTIENDLIQHRNWVFPFMSVWDTSYLKVKFPQPGKYKAYLDIYTKESNCKARYPMDIYVKAQAKNVIPRIVDDEVCSGETMRFYDSSIIFGGQFKSVQFDFEDQTSFVSDSLKLSKKMKFNESSQLSLQKYKHITITNENCKDTFENIFFVNPSPKVKFRLSQDSIQCLPNARWTFTSQSTMLNDTVYLNWNSGNGRIESGLSLRNIRYSNIGKYKVTLKGTSSIGCQDSAIQFVEAIPSPIASFTINDSAQCLKSNYFSFKSTSVGKYLKHQWFLNQNLISDSATIDSLRINNLGNQQIVLKISSINLFCKDSTEKTIQILKHPKASFVVLKDSQCFNNHNFELKQNSLYVQQYAQSEWTFNSKTDTNFNVKNIQVTQAGNYPVQLIIKDKEQCSDTSFGSFEVLEKPKFNLSINDSVQCAGQSTFIFTVNSSQSLTYHWLNNQKSIQKSIDTQLIILNPNTPNNQLKLIGNNGICSDSLIQNFVVLDALKADFNINSDTQCFKNQNFILNNNSSIDNRDGIVDYTYSVENEISKKPDYTIQTPLNKGNYTIKFKVKTKELCSDSITKPIVVLEEPVFRLIADSVCLGEASKANVVQESGNLLQKWNWNFGDLYLTNNQKPSYLFQSSGAYFLSLEAEDIYGCKNTVKLDNSLLVYNLPNAQFNFLNESTGVNQIKLTFNPVSPQIGNSYFWRFSDGNLSNEETPIIFPLELYKGRTSLTVTDQNGCQDSSFQNLLILPEYFLFNIPNAITLNNDELNDEFKVIGLENDTNFTMKIWNRWGEQVFESRDKLKGWNGQYNNQTINDGVFVYYISFKYIDGKNYEFRGTITVLR